MIVMSCPPILSIPSHFWFLACSICHDDVRRVLFLLWNFSNIFFILMVFIVSLQFVCCLLFWIVLVLQIIRNAKSLEFDHVYVSLLLERIKSFNYSLDWSFQLKIRGLNIAHVLNQSGQPRIIKIKYSQLKKDEIDYFKRISKNLQYIMQIKIRKLGK